MNSEVLNKEFETAVETINEHTEPFPADVLLKLYAYYKRATNSPDQYGKSSNPLIGAFKTNALFQAREIDPDEAKKKYIETVNHYFLYRK